MSFRNRNTGICAVAKHRDTLRDTERFIQPMCDVSRERPRAVTVRIASKRISSLTAAQRESVIEDQHAHVAHQGFADFGHIPAAQRAGRRPVCADRAECRVT